MRNPSDTAVTPLWQRFLLYGALGWVVEIAFTGVGSILSHDWNLTGQTYLWMFPIYAGAALGMEQIHNRLRRRHWLWRGFAYTGFVFVVEYASGWALVALLGSCPWEYPAHSPNISGLIRLDFAPAWMALGLVFERAHDWLLPFSTDLRLVRRRVG